MRYAAPTYLTIENASTDEVMSADRPTTAAVTCTSVPVVMPRTDTTPAKRPCSTLRPTMYSTAGPGVRSNKNPAAAKAPIWAALGMVSSIEGPDARVTSATAAAINAATVTRVKQAPQSSAIFDRTP